MSTEKILGNSKDFKVPDSHWLTGLYISATRHGDSTARIVINVVSSSGSSTCGIDLDPASLRELSAELLERARFLEEGTLRDVS
jgi:hypothetical protein